MVNVPWHEEVLNFVQTFAALLPDYEVACEHEHSNCVLIAHKKVGVALVLRVHASIPVLYYTAVFRGGTTGAVQLKQLASAHVLLLLSQLLKISSSRYYFRA